MVCDLHEDVPGQNPALIIGWLGHLQAQIQLQPSL